MVRNAIKISLKEYLIKPPKKDIETLGLYWFTQIELRLVLLYEIVKCSTNQNFDYKQVLWPSTPDYISIIFATYGTPLDSSVLFLPLMAHP